MQPKTFSVFSKSMYLALLIPLAAFATPDKCTKQIDGKIAALEMWGSTEKARDLQSERANKPDCDVRSTVSELRQTDAAFNAGDNAVKGSSDKAQKP